MSPNLSLLSRSYDLRGVYGSEIDESFFENIGKALGTWGPEGKIVVGGDARLSTSSLKKALSDGLRSVGRDVIDLGIISSDMLQYATIAYAEEVALGVMVTASHNPKEYNGFKACLKNARAINLKEIG
jgi:phosphomannomutase